MTEYWVEVDWYYILYHRKVGLTTDKVQRALCTALGYTEGSDMKLARYTDRFTRCMLVQTSKC